MITRKSGVHSARYLLYIYINFYIVYISTTNAGHERTRYITRTLSS